MKNIIEGHKFFCRKSQHYILGGWSEHQEMFRFDEIHKGAFNWDLFNYYRRFPIAYVKFMYYTIFK